jgi:hypothetical protein
MELPDLPKAKNGMHYIQRNTFQGWGRDSKTNQICPEDRSISWDNETNSKEIINIRKQKLQTNGKTDGMGTRKILDDTMTSGHGKWTLKVWNEKRRWIHEKLLEKLIEISEM